MILKNKIFEILTDDYSNRGCHYSYREQTNCDGDCEDGGTCRCSIITNATITHTNPQDILDYIFNSIKLESNNPKNTMDEPTNIYAIEQLLIHHELNNKKLFTIHIVDGLYGEEIDKVTHSNHKQLIKDIITTISFNSNISKIEYLFNLKYGCIPEQYKELNWETKELAKDNILYINNNPVLLKNNKLSSKAPKKL